MSNLFLRLLNISITAGWIVLVVVLLRFVLKKAPKWTRVALWGLVAIRLLLPVSIESALSLVPSETTVSVAPWSYTMQQSETESVRVEGERVVISSGFEALNSAVNPTNAQAASHLKPVAIAKAVAGWVWLSGAAAMLLYALISYLRLKNKVRASVRIEKGVYVCDDISDPFILGLIRPRICLPSGMDETTKGYVLAHERAHLKRFDHIWKPLGFLLLAVYWFNPLLWLAYILLCRDIELACDEKVVKEYDAENKAAYSEALLKSSVSRRSIAACPLAFGEVGVKSRVKSILNYKKPAFWIIVVAVLATIVVAVCFLTVPKKDEVKTPYSDNESEATLDAATLCTTWMLAEVDAPDGSGGSAYSLGLRQYLEFRSDGTVRMVDTNALTQRIVPYTLSGNAVQFDGRILRYEPEDKELFGVDPSTQNTLFYAPTPKVELPALLYDLSLTHDQTEAFVNGLSVEFEDGSPYGCDLVVFIDGFGTCLNVGDADAWKTASLRFVPGDYKVTDAIYAHVGYAKLLTVGDREYYIGSIRVFLSDGQFDYHHQIWDYWYPSADASIFVSIDPSMMENRLCPERACVIKSFDAEAQTVTVSYVSFEEPEDGYPAEILYDTVEDETFTFSVTDDTMLTLIDDYTALVKPARFFRYLEQYGYMYLDRPDSDDPGVGFWIGIDGDTLLYLCEVYEE